MFPDNKEINDKLPTISVSNFAEIDGGPYPAFSTGPIHTVQNVSTILRGRHTFKAGISFEYSGQNDFDQINVSAVPGSTNNQNGRFEFLDGRAGGTGVGVANMALGLFSNYAELGERNLTEWRSLATDVFVQDSWRRPQADGRRWVPLRLLAALVLDHQQHRHVCRQSVHPGQCADREPPTARCRVACATTA